jgi:taurine dioxygenase
MLSLQAPQSQSLISYNQPFEVIPLKPFGAEVVGFDFSSTLDGAQLLLLRVALIEHKMLLFRDRRLSAQEQIAFTRLFGHELHRAGPSLRYLPDYPEIFRITNRPGGGNPNTGQYWHADGHYLADPSSVTVMHIVNATGDGPTQVSDSADSYARLSEQDKEYLSWYGFFAPETGVAHPILRPHPLTGRMGLYVNLRAVPINRSMQQFPEVSCLLDDHLSQPRTFYEHHWKHGDTMVVDNFATAHRGMPSNPGNLRVMHRTTVTGPSVWWKTLQ